MRPAVVSLAQVSRKAHECDQLSPAHLLELHIPWPPPGWCFRRGGSRAGRGSNPKVSILTASLQRRLRLVDSVHKPLCVDRNLSGPSCPSVRVCLWTQETQSQVPLELTCKWGRRIVNRAKNKGVRDGWMKTERCNFGLEDQGRSFC